MTHEEILQKAAKELEAGRPALTTVADALWYEREALARLCEDRLKTKIAGIIPHGVEYDAGCLDCAAVIRARGK